MTTNTLASSETPSSKRILVVDDDADTRESLTELLRGEGYEVSSSPDGEAALQQLRRTPVDLILLDLYMPVMNGWRFRTLQRAEHGLGETPVIALSGEESAQAEAIDAACYIRKPLPISEHLLDLGNRADKPGNSPSRSRGRRRRRCGSRHCG
jgi:CheY-like chemotaxis protein